MSKLKITLVRSLIGNDQAQRDTVRSLGLHRLNDSVVQEDSRPVLGMIHRVRHLITVEEIADAAK